MKMFAVILFGALMGGSLMAAPMDMNQDASVQVMPDGTKLIKAEDGTTVEVRPDGTKIIKKANGTTVEIKPDGSKTIKTRGNSE